MKLQEFIEVNHGKALFGGGTFTYDKVILSVRQCSMQEPNIYEVVMGIPMNICYSDRFDILALDGSEGYMVGFFKWLEEAYFPKAEEGIRKRLNKKVDG